MQGRILEQYSEFYTTIYYFINGLSYIIPTRLFSAVSAKYAYISSQFRTRLRSHQMTCCLMLQTEPRSLLAVDLCMLSCRYQWFAIYNNTCIYLVYRNCLYLEHVFVTSSLSTNFPPCTCYHDFLSHLFCMSIGKLNNSQ